MISRNQALIEINRNATQWFWLCKSLLPLRALKKLIGFAETQATEIHILMKHFQLGGQQIFGYGVNIV